MNAKPERTLKTFFPETRILDSPQAGLEGLPIECSHATMKSLLRKFGALVTVLVLALAHTGCAHGEIGSGSRAGTLANAREILSTRRWVDLTHAFSPRTPVWPGFGPASFNPATNQTTGKPFSVEADGFHAMSYSFVGQYGTHIDPPAHFSAGGQTLDQLSVTNMILRLVVFDLTPKLREDPDHALTVSDILDWELVHGRVPPGAFAALRTDMSRHWNSNPRLLQRSPFPGWSLEAIRFLYERRGITANGHESLDTDATDGLESESWLLRAGHWQIEAMANLDQVPATGSLIVVAWPKPEGGLGFPVRAFAILP